MNTTQARKRLAKLVDFSSLTREEARVEIARDVIAALAIGKLKASHVYLGTNTVPTQLGQPIEPYKINDCQVCALGAVFVAATARKAISINATYSATFTHVVADDMRERLDAYFSRDDLFNIEEAYESYESYDRSPRAIAKGVSTSEESKDRMIDIMQNIIDNKGAFVRSQLTP